MLKKIKLPLSLVSFFWVVSSPVAAEDVSPLSIPLNFNMDVSKSLNVNEVEHVDLHTIFVLDVSSSVSSKEKSVMMEGIHNALTSDEVGMHFSRGLKRAITFVYFADTADSTQTYIASNQREAIDVAEQVVWNPLLGRPAQNFDSVGKNTQMLSAFHLVSDIFGSEHLNGVSSAAKTVVVMADDPSQGSNADIRAQSDALTTLYGASVFCAPITNAGYDAPVTNFFMEHVVTPSGALRYDQYGFAAAVKAGIVRPVREPSDAAKVVAAALNLNGY